MIERKKERDEDIISSSFCGIYEVPIPLYVHVLLRLLYIPTPLLFYYLLFSQLYLERTHTVMATLRPVQL